MLDITSCQSFLSPHDSNGQHSQSSASSAAGVAQAFESSESTTVTLPPQSRLTTMALDGYNIYVQKWFIHPVTVDSASLRADSESISCAPAADPAGPGATYRTAHSDPVAIPAPSGLAPRRREGWLRPSLRPRPRRYIPALRVIARLAGAAARPARLPRPPQKPTARRGAGSLAAAARRAMR